MDMPLEPLPSPSDVQSQSSTEATKKKSLVGILLAAGLFAAAGGIGYVIGNVAFTPLELGLPGWQKALFVAGILVLMPLVLAIHEGGHLLGGKLARFRFVLFIVGPLMISRQKDRIKFSVNKSLGAYGGLAGAFPTDTVNLRTRLMMFVAGGPLASLSTGVLFLGLSLLVPERAQESPSAWLEYARFSLGGLGFASLLIALVTMIPGKTSGFLTDGARLRLLFKGGPAADREMAIWHITTTSMAGHRPAAWPEDALQRAMSLGDEGPFEYVARSFAYLHALDTRNYPDARAHLDRSLDLWHKLPKTLQPGLAQEIAYFEAVARNDAKRARAWFDHAGNSPFIDPATKIRSEAAVLLAEGRMDEANASLAGADQALATILDAGMAKAQHAWMQELRANALA